MLHYESMTLCNYLSLMSSSRSCCITIAHSLQIQGSKLGRLGVLFTAFQNTDVSSLIFAEVFERAVSSYRLVNLPDET